MPASRRALGIAAGIATAALWGSNHVVARAVREQVPLPARVFEGDPLAKLRRDRGETAEQDVHPRRDEQER